MMLAGVFFESFTQNSSSCVFFAGFLPGVRGPDFLPRKSVHGRFRQFVLKRADELQIHLQVPALQRRAPQ